MAQDKITEETYRYCSLWVPTTMYEDYQRGGIGVRSGIYAEFSPPFQLTGYFYIDEPVKRVELLHDLREIYGNKLEIVTEGIFNRRKALICRMGISKKSREYLVPLKFSDPSSKTKKHLDELLGNEFLPTIKIWFDENVGYYKAKIPKQDFPEYNSK